MLEGQPVPDLRQNRQPPDTRIENPDRPWIAHGALLYPFDAPSNKLAPVLTFDRDRNRFNHRVAGACIHEGHVLLTHAEGENFWILPGGRVELLEDTRTALKREMSEELGCETNVGRLLWVVEGFFELSGRNYHEVAFIYELQPMEPSVLHHTWTCHIIDGGMSIEFRWFPLQDLAPVNLQPAFLRKALQNSPTNTTHLVRRELPRS